MNTSVYNTTDTALAAFLAISGIKLVRLNTEQKLAVYTFEDHNILQDLVWLHSPSFPGPAFPASADSEQRRLGHGSG